MNNVFEGQTADEVWQTVAARFRDLDAPPQQASRAGDTRELLHALLILHNPRERFVHSRLPPMNLAFAFAEILWILAGRNDSAFLNYFLRDLPKYAGDGPTYHGAYGFRLRRHFGVDQLERAYHILRTNPESRQVVLQIWDPQIDLPTADGKPVAPDIPCNIMSLLKVRAGALEWMQIVRSNDLYRGLPYNFVQFTVLHEIMAGWLGVPLGTYRQVSDSLHVYAADEPQIQKSIPGSQPRNSDSLAIPKETSDAAFRDLMRCADVIVDERVSADQVMAMTERASLLPTFQNMLCVIAAEGARRRGRYDMCRTIMDRCTNQAYIALWQAWSLRGVAPAWAAPSDVSGA